MHTAIPLLLSHSDELNRSETVPGTNHVKCIVSGLPSGPTMCWVLPHLILTVWLVQSPSTGVTV